MNAIGRTRLRTLMAIMVLATSAAATACSMIGTRGEGAITSETRQTDPFTRVESGTGIHVSVGIGEAKPVEVRAQANILPLIETKVTDGTLRIESSKAFTSSEKIEVILATPELERIVLSGGSRGAVDGLASEAFDAQLSGGSVLTAAGTASDLSLDASGGSVAELDGLTAGTVDVDISGGSRAAVRATDEVQGSATGGSRVTIAGGANSTVDTSGGSQVEQR